MEIFSSRTTPTMEVAMAVRMSMSVPFAFKPVSYNNSIYVDGGLAANYPLFLVSNVGDKYWNVSDIDNNRPKVGFIVDETMDAGRGFNPPRFSVTRGMIDKKTLYEELLMQILKKSGFNIPEVPNPFEAITDEIIKDFIRLLMNNTPYFMYEMFGCMKINSENSVRSFMNKSLMKGSPYSEIVIPLLGYDAADFKVNQDADATIAMWERAWDAAKKALSERVDPFDPLVRPDYNQNPYS